MGGSDLYVSSWGTYDPNDGVDCRLRTWRISIWNPRRDHSVPRPEPTVLYLSLPEDVNVAEVFLYACALQEWMYP